VWLTAIRAHRSVPRGLVRTRTALAAHRRTLGSSLRLDRWPTGTRLLRWPGLHRTGRQTSSGNNSLLGSVKSNTECLLLVSHDHIYRIYNLTYPTVIILMQQPHNLADLQFHLIIHRGLEIELYTVD
jgi:hypothetical protein